MHLLDMSESAGLTRAVIVTVTRHWRSPERFDGGPSGTAMLNVVPRGAQSRTETPIRPKTCLSPDHGHQI